MQDFICTTLSLPLCGPVAEADHPGEAPLHYSSCVRIVHSLIAQSMEDCRLIDNARSERARFAEFEFVVHSHSASFFNSPHSLVPDTS
ncbi:hypothetical protein IQ06DRAFT_51696 [Phaeosphaeriaceae sp. SRC1lsM3a]|nr:hypothetical protein IQ06DRAFT_51696 [Stagonospora sp. SRC1lsM3a]